MLLPISLLLLLALCVPANGAANLEAYEDSSYDGTPSNYFSVDEHTASLKNDRINLYTDTYITKDQPQKRAISRFLQAWREILKTTFGSNSYLYRNGNTVMKIYLKQGSADDAFTDFYSLRPTKTWQSPDDGSLIGISENHVFELQSAKGYDGPILHLLNGKDAHELYGIASPNRIEREIIYVDRSDTF